MGKKTVEIYKKYCKKVGRPFKGEPSEDLKFSVKFLGWKLDPSYIIGAGKFSMLLGFLIMVVLGVVSFFLQLNSTGYFLFSPLVVLIFYLVTEWPKGLAKQAANRSLSKAPYIMAQVAVSLKQNPNMESSIAFVSKAGSGKIARELRDILFHAWTGKVTSVYPEVLKMADRWARFSVGFQRSLHLVISSFYERSKKAKDKTLDLAVDTILADITSSMHSYAISLHMPTLVLFSMGTILPLMLISLFPLVSFFGFRVSQLAVTALLGSSLVGTYIYSNRTLSKRPVGFALPKIRVIEKERKALPVLVFALLSVPTFLFLSGQFEQKTGFVGFIVNLIGPFGIVWGLGIALSIYFYRASAGIRKLRKEIKVLENQFTDSLYHIRNHLRDGNPLESSIEFTGSMLQNIPIGKYFSKVLNLMNTRSLTLEGALEQEGSGSTVISSAFKMLTNATAKGRVAIMQTADVVYIYLNRIKKIEANIGMMLAKTLSMMRATIMIFAPVVCAIIVVLFMMIDTTIKNVVAANKDYSFGTIFAAPSIAPETLQIIVGIYLIALNYVFIRYISHVQHGFDKASFRYDLAQSIPITLLIFTITLVVSRAFLLRL